MAASDILKEMMNNANDEIENIESALEQMDEQILILDEQIDAVENGMCVQAKNQLIDYLENVKLLLFPLGTLTYGSNFGIIDYETGGITDFEITEMDETAIPPESVVVYEYEGTGWDNDQTIIKLINDYNFGNDYLTRPLDSGATYGLKPNRNNLGQAKTLLQNNANKILNSKTAFDDYV